MNYWIKTESSRNKKDKNFVIACLVAYGNKQVIMLLLENIMLDLDIFMMKI